MSSKETKGYEQLYVRAALAITMLSAVADRFGWGPDTSWGNWENFLVYSRQLTFYLPGFFQEPAAVIATTLEIVLPLCLLAGFKTKLAAYATGFLLLVFALSMTFSIGFRSTLAYSVWVGSSAGFLLAVQQHYTFSLDGYLARNRRAG
ncbi:DoxX family membrane protein [Chitinophaga barathri]|uniref:DoxX family membrane protein n=1 Tax=Chitinophaga barathri TaxID=1647451 RepID=A0A3N4M8D7_9BACT|nr:DoxX family membrane protein [Chitinophaga barathri]RPD39515.1 DoxX family membrane protein [Chitinophaga barathri]